MDSLVICDLPNPQIVNSGQRPRAQVEQFSLFIPNTPRQKGMQFSQFIHKENAIYLQMF